MTVDPAATAERYSDDTGVIIGAVNSEGFLYVVEAKKIHLKPDKMVDELIRLIVQYRPKTVGIELGLQAGIQYLLDIKKREYEEITGKPLRFKLEQIDVPRSMSKEDKINRVLGGVVRTGRVFINQSLADLLLQMEFFPKGEHDDLVDALTMMVQIITEFTSGNSGAALKDRSYRPDSLFGMFKQRLNSSWEAKFVA
jgi:predicted phage terminase large subunit-like protein